MKIKGFTANHVETEQIVIENSTSLLDYPNLSSFIQLRSSAPVYWLQEPHLYLPKPPIRSKF